ncbi:MAG: Csu type fimbrial protein [Panacagrimonas sp.]
MKPSARCISVASFACGALLASSGVAAATATSSFNVTTTVIDVCAVSASNLGFGTYSPIAGSALDGATTITITCTLGTPYNVQLDPGAHGGGSVSTRQMQRTSGGTETINYSLFRNAGRTQNWGQTDNTDTLSATGTGVSQGHTVYGRIPASENVPTGDYSDTVNVTVSY